MNSAITESTKRAIHQIQILTTSVKTYPALSEYFTLAPPIQLPESKDGILQIAHRL